MEEIKMRGRGKWKTRVKKILPRLGMAACVLFTRCRNGFNRGATYIEKDRYHLSLLPKLDQSHQPIRNALSRALMTLTWPHFQ